MTDESDWPLIHSTVRRDVAAGKLSAADEQAYAAMVDKKLGERAVRNEKRSTNLVFSAAKSKKQKAKIKALKAKIKRLQQHKSKE